MAESRRRFRRRKSLAYFGAAFVVLLCTHAWYASTVHVTGRCVLSDDGRSVEYTVTVRSHRACDVFLVTRTADGSETTRTGDSSQSSERESSDIAGLGLKGFPWCLHGMASFRSEQTGTRSVDAGTKVVPPGVIDVRIFRETEWPLWSTPAGENGPAEQRFLIVRPL